jgi:hypothetical protein
VRLNKPVHRSLIKIRNASPRLASSTQMVLKSLDLASASSSSLSFSPPGSLKIWLCTRPCQQPRTSRYRWQRREPHSAALGPTRLVAVAANTGGRFCWYLQWSPHLQRYYISMGRRGIGPRLAITSASAIASGARRQRGVGGLGPPTGSCRGRSPSAGHAKSVYWNRGRPGTSPPCGTSTTVLRKRRTGQFNVMQSELHSSMDKNTTGVSDANDTQPPTFLWG